MDAKKTGELINRIRIEKGYTQAALAERLNISNRTVSKWENGDGFPDISILPELAAVLGITTDELLAGERKEATLLTENQDKPPYPTFRAQGAYRFRTNRLLYRYIFNLHFPLWLRIFISVGFGFAIAATIKTADRAHPVSLVLPLLIYGGVICLMFFYDYYAALLQRAMLKAKNGGALPDSDFIVSDKVELTQGAEHYSYPLSAITAFDERKELFVLRLNKKLFIGCDKGRFAEGTAEEFSAYMRTLAPPPKRSKTIKLLHAATAILFGLLIALFALLLLLPSSPAITEEDIALMDYEALYENFCETTYSAASPYALSTDAANLNAEERRAVLVAEFYEEYMNGGLCQYFCNASGRYAYELAENLRAMEMDELADAYTDIVTQYNIDLSRYKVNTDYDEEMLRYDFYSIDNTLEEVVMQAEIPLHVGKYIKDHAPSFANQSMPD